MGCLYAKDVINTAINEIGYHESGENWTKYAEQLDDCNYFEPQKKQNVAWCAIFCDWCCMVSAIPEDRDDDSKKYDAQYFLYQPSYYNYSASASLFASYFSTAGAWHREPEKGDIVFFKDNTGAIVHCGIVEDIDGCLTTIEGNAGDQVQRKWYDFDSPRIAGYGRPRYDGYGSSDDNEPKPAPEVKEVNITIKAPKDIKINVNVEQ